MIGKYFGRRIAILGTVILIAGCAQASRWQHPGIPIDQWSTDAAACRGYARGTIERDSRAEALFPPREQTTLQRQMGQFQMQKRQLGFFDDCMRRKGYEKVKKKDMAA